MREVMLRNVMRIAVLATEDQLAAAFLREVLQESDEDMARELRNTCWADIICQEPISRKEQMRAELAQSKLALLNFEEPF